MCLCVFVRVYMCVWVLGRLGVWVRMRLPMFVVVHVAHECTQLSCAVVSMCTVRRYERSTRARLRVVCARLCASNMFLCGQFRPYTRAHTGNYRSYCILVSQIFNHSTQMIYRKCYLLAGGIGSTQRDGHRRQARELGRPELSLVTCWRFWRQNGRKAI